MEWNRISLITLFEMNKIQSNSPRSIRFIDSMFDTSVIHSKDEPNSILMLK